MKQTLLFFALGCALGLAEAAEPEAVTRQLTRPVLIRNEHNSLLRLTVKVDKPFVQVKSIAVAVEGAGDIESLQFYFTVE